MVTKDTGERRLSGKRLKSDRFLIPSSLEFFFIYVFLMFGIVLIDGQTNRLPIENDRKLMTEKKDLCLITMR